MSLSWYNSEIQYARQSGSQCVYNSQSIKSIMMWCTNCGQYHGCFPVLQRPLWIKLQATECYINRSCWYLFRSTRCKMGEQTRYCQIAYTNAPFIHTLLLIKISHSCTIHVFPHSHVSHAPQDSLTTFPSGSVFLTSGSVSPDLSSVFLSTSLS